MRAYFLKKMEGLKHQPSIDCLKEIMEIEDLTFEKAEEIANEHYKGGKLSKWQRTGVCMIANGAINEANDPEYTVEGWSPQSW